MDEYRGLCVECTRKNKDLDCTNQLVARIDDGVGTCEQCGGERRRLINCPHPLER